MTQYQLLMFTLRQAQGDISDFLRTHHICLLYFSGVKYFSRAEVREIVPPVYSLIFIKKENVIYAYGRKFFISGY